MDFDFGGTSQETSNGTSTDVNNGTKEEITSLETNKPDNGDKTDLSGKELGNKQDDTSKNPEGTEGDETNPETNYEEGTTIEVDGEIYTADKDGNLLDKEGNIFKNANEVAEWLKDFDKEDISSKENKLNIDNIIKSVGIEVTDENDKPVVFDNTPEGIKSYIEAVNEINREENYNTAINTLYERYPILNDVLTYYIANGNSLEGFNEVQDRSGITIDDANEAQQESIIRTAWKEQDRKGDVEGYIQYLKTSGTLLATAREELEGLQEADKQYKAKLEAEAEKQEQERIQELTEYWDGVHNVIKSRKIAGYEIPENIIINRDGKKLSATVEDFYNYIYRVDENGNSAYELDLMNESVESRTNDNILRAYLKFVGGNYSNLVNMAINKEKVANIKLKAKERNKPTVRISKPQHDSKKLDLGYN